MRLLHWVVLSCTLVCHGRRIQRADQGHFALTKDAVAKKTKSFPEFDANCRECVKNGNYFCTTAPPKKRCNGPRGPSEVVLTRPDNKWRCSEDHIKAAVWAKKLEGGGWMSSKPNQLAITS